MLYIKSGDKEFAIDFKDLFEGIGLINDDSFNLDFIKKDENSYHVIYNNRSFNIYLVAWDEDEKTIRLSVNGNEYAYSIENNQERLLKEMGMSANMVPKVKDIKAPMPGLVLDVKVSETERVEKGDALIVLEAMKMENILKSPITGVVKKIQVKTGEAVEKNEVLINFE